MAKIKLTKTELKAQTDALKRFQRFLPMLQLKKQQLQGEIAGIVQKAEETSAKERAVRADLDRWVGLFATDEDLIAGLVKVKDVRTGTANVAGVAIPTFESIETDVKEIDAWATPATFAIPVFTSRTFTRPAISCSSVAKSPTQRSRSARTARSFADVSSAFCAMPAISP